MDRNERERLRQTFDAVAADYQDARPEYPAELYAALLSLTGVRPEADALCEVGCASGKATLPLARQGFAITGIELGAALAAQARRNLAAFERVKVVNADFETWTPRTLPLQRGNPAGPGREVRGYGLVFAATAWHWIDPAVKYGKAAALLRPGGHLAFWEAVHVRPDGGDPFFEEIQEVYDAIGSGVPPGYVFARPDTLAGQEAEIAASGLFSDITVQRFDWEIRYTADSYIRLLETFSSNLMMAPWQRERLYGEIRARLARRPDGIVRRHWGAVLHVARAAGPAPAPAAAATLATAQARKLGLKAGHRVALDAAPAAWALTSPPAGLFPPDDDGGADVILAFFRAADQLTARLPALAARVFPAGAIWALWPRRAAGHVSDITDNVVRACALELGLVDVKVAAVDENWSGLRLVWRTGNRG